MYSSHDNRGINYVVKEWDSEWESKVGYSLETVFSCGKSIKQKFKNINDELIENLIENVNINISYIQSISPILCHLQRFSSWVYEHSVNVALISTILAVELGYDEKSMRELCIGALLHDIGKLLIPKAILQKPGKLNEAEMEIMRQHSVLGYNIIANLDMRSGSKAIVLQHHERLDGSGYPFGLFKNSISEGSKIVMLADTLDAMTSCRPYRKALTADSAIEIIKDEKGKYSEDILDILNWLIGS